MCPSYQERTAYERSTAADASTAGRTLLRVLCLSTLNNVRLHPCRYRQSPRRNTTVQVATFVLNDCLAYLRFGRYWPIASLCGDSKIRSLSLCSGRACCAGPAAHQHRTIISPNPLRRDRERESRAPGAKPAKRLERREHQLIKQSFYDVGFIQRAASRRL